MPPREVQLVEFSSSHEPVYGKQQRPAFGQGVSQVPLAVHVLVEPVQEVWKTILQEPLTELQQEPVGLVRAFEAWGATAQVVSAPIQLPDAAVHPSSVLMLHTPATQHPPVAGHAPLVQDEVFPRYWAPALAWQTV